MKTVNSLQKYFVAALLACTLGSAQAAVVFSESLTDAVIKSVVGVEFNTHNFTVSEDGIYRATITDLVTVDPSFLDDFDLLSMKVTGVPSSGFFGPAGSPGGVAYFDFAVTAAGSFAALVKAISGSAGTDFSAYQVQVARIGPIPEPGVWLLMLGGLGLIGWMRLRKSQELS